MIFDWLHGLLGGIIVGYLAAPLVQVAWTKMKKAITNA